LREVIAYDD